MSRTGRLALTALAVAAVAVAFVIVRPGDDDDSSGTAAPAEPAETAPPTATAPSAPTPPPDGPDAVTVRLVDGAPAGGTRTVKAAKGDRVRLVVTSDAPDEIHVHGYDLERPVAPGRPARFSFVASIEGVFEIESHEAEHEGKDAPIARLVVEPS